MNGVKIVFFDGVCNLCNNSVQFILKNNTKKNLYFSSLQSDFAQQFLKDKNIDLIHFESILYYKNDEIYSHSDAILEITKELKGCYPYLGLLKFFPKFIRDTMYKWISRNRYRWFGRQATCWVPSPDLKSRFIE